MKNIISAILMLQMLFYTQDNKCKTWALNHELLYFTAYVMYIEIYFRI